MSLPLSPAQAELIAKAYTTGAETSVKELAGILGLDDTAKLAAAGQVLDFVDSLKLELVPPPEEAEFESIRVLRVARPSLDPLAEVEQLLAVGESPSIEFKSSMVCSMREWEASSTRVEHPALAGEILKTLCAFLNTDGGDLLVGVSDDAKPCAGLRLDLELRNWNLDKWQLHFQSLVVSRFHEGAHVQAYLRPQMLGVDSESVFHVRVMPRARRSFVQREKGKAYEYFVRNGPRTDSLDLPTFYSHLMGSSPG